MEDSKSDDFLDTFFLNCGFATRSLHAGEHASMTHACVPKEKREKGGLTDGLVRISVGIEDQQDLVRALDDALGQV